MSNIWNTWTTWSIRFTKVAAPGSSGLVLGLGLVKYSWVLLLHLTTALPPDCPPVSRHQRVVSERQRLVILSQTRSWLIVALNTVILHHAAEQRHEVRILTSLAPHATGEPTFSISGFTSWQNKLIVTIQVHAKSIQVKSNSLKSKELDFDWLFYEGMKEKSYQ